MNIVKETKYWNKTYYCQTKFQSSGKMFCFSLIPRARHLFRVDFLLLSKWMSLQYILQTY